MTHEQRLALYREYLDVLITDPLSAPVWLYLNYKFMSPAMMIARNDAAEEFVKRYSLNGIKSNLGNICKPY